MNYLDLFSGIGGFALGAYMAGVRFERHYFSEIDPWCCELYARRFPDAVPLGDIREINGTALVENSGNGTGWREEARIVRGVPENGEGRNPVAGSSGEWIITGGFPCQDISVAGKGAGIEGLRSGLWFEYARLIGEIRPRYAIMENVGALTRRGIDRVLGSLAEIGYDAEWSDIRASDVGAPHRRERIWIVAYPGDSGQRKLLQPIGQPRGNAETYTRGNGEVQPMADAEHATTTRQRINGGKGLPIAESTGLSESGSGNGAWWAVEPDMGRVAHGVPSRVDRLRGLGNSIVPQIAEMIFRGLEL